MRIWDYSRSAFGICAAAAMLAGCSGSQPPIGNRNEYDAFRGGCARSEQDFASPGGTMVAALRLVECSGAPVVPPSRDYFIFVHKLNYTDANDKDTLAVGYREWSDAAGWRTEPKVTWLRDSLLQVHMGNPSLTTTKRFNVNGIDVIYASGGIKLGADFGPKCPGSADWCDL